MNEVVYKELKDKGEPDWKIANHFHVSEETLGLWKRRKGIRVSDRFKKADDYYLLKNRGFRESEIARNWGISNQALYAWKKRNLRSELLMNTVDTQYLSIANHILKHGEVKEDRTGTGTISVFSPPEMRFNLQDGFPLLTTKKLHIPSIVHELIWFIKGDTNIKYLLDNGVNIWNADAYRWYSNSNYFQGESFETYIQKVKTDEDFAKKYADLGTIYGWGWRNWGKKPEQIMQPKPKLREGVEPTYLGVANGSGSYKHPLGKTWEGMIARCYDKNNISYPIYGGKGVFVCNDWLEFKKFADDATTLIGWENKLNSETRYVLDKDTIGNGFEYSINTCCWITDYENINAKSDKLYTVEKDGKEYQFINPTSFCREHEIDNRNFSDLWTGKNNAKQRYGFKLVKVEDLNKGKDQLKALIEGLKNNPNGRRHIINAWNAEQLNQMALPPCHVMFQCYVSNDGGLSLKMYQRSADHFLGVPFNIASYSLLVHMIAQVTGLYAKEFIWTGGDSHIYLNHVDQIKTQLNRKPKELPRLELNPFIKDIDEFTAEDIVIKGYDPHDLIKGRVSVG